MAASRLKRCAAGGSCRRELREGCWLVLEEVRCGRELREGAAGGLLPGA